MFDLQKITFFNPENWIFVPYLVIFAVLAIFLYFIFSLLYKGILIKNELKETVKMLQRIDRKSLNIEFVKIDSFFRNRKSMISHYWHEFEESLVRKEGEVFNTIDADHFFSTECLIERPLGIDFSRNLPGIFTAMGIIGTFLGIYIGLGQASVSFREINIKGKEISESGEILNRAVQSLFEHITPAFLASLVAVICAVIYLFAERIWVSSINKELNDLQYNLDRLFPRTTSEGYLIKILEESEKQTRYVVNSLVGEMGQSMKSAVDEMVGSLNKTYTDLIGELGHNVKSELLLVSENLLLAVDEFKTDQTQSTQDIIKRMASEFSSSLQEKAKGQFQDMVYAIGGVSQILKNTKSEFQDFINNVKERDKNYYDFLGKEMQRFSRETQISQTEMRKESENFVKTVISQMRDIQAEAIEKSSQSLINAHKEIAVMYEKSHRDFNEMFRGFVNKSSGEFTSQLKMSLAEMARMIQVLSESSLKANEEFSRRLAQQSFLLESYTSETNKRIYEVSTALESNIAVFSDMVAEMNRLTQNVHTELSSSLDISRSFMESSKSVELISADLYKSSDLMKKIAGSFLEIIGKFEELQNKLNEDGRNFEKITASMNLATEALTVQYGSSGEFLSKISYNLDEYHKSVNRALKEYTARLDEYTAKISEHLAAGIEPVKEFRDGIDEFMDRLEKMSEKRVD